MNTKRRLRATEQATESMAEEIVRLQTDLADAEAEKAHLKTHLLSLESSNAALQAQLVQARAENVSHLREIAAWRKEVGR